MVNFEKSIVLIGGVGAGKSTISNVMARKKDVPVISIDAFRRLPKLDVLEARLNDPNFPDKEAIKRDIKLRKQFPTIKSYEDFGYDAEFSKQMQEKYGPIGWHFYEKQFENLLMEHIFETLDGEYIFDTGGGATVSLDKDYELIKAKLSEDELKKFPHMDQIGFDKTKQILKKFSRICYVKLPQDKAKWGERAKQSERDNDMFLSTGQYEQLATDSIEMDGIYENGSINSELLEEKVDIALGYIKKELPKPDKKEEKIEEPVQTPVYNQRKSWFGRLKERIGNFFRKMFGIKPKAQAAPRNPLFEPTEAVIRRVSRGELSGELPSATLTSSAVVSAATTKKTEKQAEVPENNTDKPPEQQDEEVGPEL